jgi:alpha-L-fucosidase
MTNHLPRIGCAAIFETAAMFATTCSFAQTTGGSVTPADFKAAWESLENNYSAPEWFRDAKFGIWAHWGPQCEEEAGDWYARFMYDETSRQGKIHKDRYGSASQFGFKDVINKWKAENWDPEKLVKIYKEAGAKYMIALACHHDNFDLWDSTYQPWNSTKLGPKKNIIAGWAKAARDNGLYFGVSMHASHAWQWYEFSQGADKTGKYAGVPYDGNLTKADGKGQWWEGLDPQDLYAQRHPLNTAKNWDDYWDFGPGVARPTDAYIQKYKNRTIELVDKYQPDILYFDDTVMPMAAISNVGLEIVSHYYNASAAKNGGRPQVVVNSKVLDENQRRGMVWDVERGTADKIMPCAWQTDTCIGDWHYDRDHYYKNDYKSASCVLQMLADIVSKNGNLLLSVPIRADGTIDDEEMIVVRGIGAWIKVNGEAIYGTRPWVVFGEGPAIANVKPLHMQGFNEGTQYTSEDIRFTKKGDAIYIIVMMQPKADVCVHEFGKAAGRLGKAAIKSISIPGSDEKVEWKINDDALVIMCPKTQTVSNGPFVFKVETTSCVGNDTIGGKK